MTTNLNTLYAAAKSEAKQRDYVYNAFLDGNHPDAARIFNLHNRVVSDIVREYKQNGGKRDLSELVRDGL